MKDITPVADNVDLIKLEDKEIYLVGTAHISHKSTELVEATINQYHPDTVAVELCEPRYQSLKDPNRWKNTDIVSVIKTGKAYVLFMQLLLAGYQKKLGDKLNIKPGAEMMRAVQVGEAAGAKIELVDREVRTTMKRAWASIGTITAIKLFSSLVGAMFDKKGLEEAEIEKLKNSDALESMMKEFSDRLPGLRSVLIDERDQYLSEKIRRIPGKKIVAVVGAGHCPGIRRWIGEQVDLAKLDEIPPPSTLRKISEWLVPVSVVGMVAAGFFMGGKDTTFEMVYAWILATSLSAAIGAGIALAHPLTVISGAIVAPFTTINPFLAAGWITGLVEAMIRRPRVSDFETITDDIMTFKGMWRNRIIHIILIIASTNLATTIGMIVGGSIIASFL